MTGKIEARFILRGENRTDAAFKGVNKNLKTAEGGLSKLKSTAAAVFAALAGGAFVRGNVAAYAQQEQAVAALDSSLRSMGRSTVGLSGQLQTLASQIQGEGIIGDEAIIQGQSFLTTYADITDKLLPRTTRVMADLAAKMGGNTTDAANLLGKASLGMVGSLSKVGISLSDTAKQSKDFELILSEIEQQVGGMNKALGDTATGAIKQFGNAWGDIREDMGGVVAIGLADHMRDLARVMGEGGGVAESWGSAIRGAIYTVQGVLISLVSEMQVQWVTASAAFEAYGAVLRSAFDSVAGAFRSSVAGVVEYVAGIANIFGQFSGGDAMRAYAAELRGASAAAKPLAQVIEEINAARDAEVGGLREAAALTVEDIEGKRNHKKATEDQAAATKSLALNVVEAAAADKLGAENRAGYLSLLAEGEKITRANQTPLEKYGDEILRLNGLWQAGAVDSEVYGAAVLAAQEQFVGKSKEQADVWTDVWSSAGNRFAAGIGDAVADVILQQQNFADSARALARSVLSTVISTLVEIGIKKTALWILEKGQLAATTAAAVASNAAISASAAPAAAGVSLATAGANAVPASAGIGSVYGLTAGLSAAGQAHDGLDYVPREGSYILDKGEMVLDKGTSDSVRNAAAGGGGGVYVSMPVNISAIDAKGVDAVLRNRRGLLGSMARAAVNDALRASGRRALV